VGAVVGSSTKAIVRRDDPPDGRRSGRLRTRQPFGADHETLPVSSPPLPSDGLARVWRRLDGDGDGGSTVAVSGFRMVRPYDPPDGRRAVGAMVKMTVIIAGGHSAPVTGWPATAPLLGSDGLARVRRRTDGSAYGGADGAQFWRSPRPSPALSHIVSFLVPSTVRQGLAAGRFSDWSERPMCIRAGSR
jgi:hypothetical protein